MFFVGAAVVDVAPVDVDVAGDVEGVDAIDDTAAAVVVGAAALVVPVVGLAPFPHDAITTAIKQMHATIRRPLTQWTLPVERRGVTARTPDSPDSTRSLRVDPGEPHSWRDRHGVGFGTLRPWKRMRELLV